MSRAGHAASAATKWLGPTCAAIAGAVLLAALLRPLAERSLIEAGVAYMAATYDMVLPLVGLGVASAQMTRWQTLLVIIMFAAGVLLGILSEERLLSAMAVEPGSAGRFVFIGPSCCVIAGLALVAPGSVRFWTASDAAACVGVALGFLIAFNDPSVGDVQFACGAVAAGLWLIAAPSTVLRRLDGSWLKIGGRVFASWLVAIGLMVGGSKFVAGQRAERLVAGTAVPPASPSLPLNDPAFGDNPPAPELPGLRNDESRQP